MSLSRTISRLKRGREAFASLHSAMPSAPHRPIGGSRLRDLEPSFANPGNLRARYYLPSNGTGPTGLLVVLHGCTQHAEGYDRGSGWSALAQRHGFALLYPEQQRENNHNLCFNWYQASDATRGRGEAASIAAMVKAVASAHAIPANRTFVTGLSAGGAMTAVMLATYPELFAGGAVIAGLPYGCAGNVSEAFECMAGRLPAGRNALAAKVRTASQHQGPWPRLSVWHGSADRIVAPANADALIAQWTALHGLAPGSDRAEQVDGQRRQVWLAPDGSELIERYDVAGMAHGTPLMPGVEAGQSGEAGAHMLDVGLSSTDRIAEFFGLIPPNSAGRGSAHQARARDSEHSGASASSFKIPGVSSSIQDTIERALRSAGIGR